MKYLGRVKRQGSDLKMPDSFREVAKTEVYEAISRRGRHSTSCNSTRSRAGETNSGSDRSLNTRAPAHT